MPTNGQIASGTTVKNTSGASRFFGFLGDRGMTLANNATVVVPGHFPAALQLDHRRNRRDYDAALAALAAGRISIVTTPVVVLKNATTGLSKKLGVDQVGSPPAETLGVASQVWAG